MSEFALQRTLVHHIPVVWLEPEVAGSSRHLVIWLPGFGGTKEAVEPQLRDLAAAGFIALSFDPWQHGERLAATQDELVQRILGNIRSHFWPILAQTALETARVIDWAIEELDVDGKVGIGGISMGGDIAVAAAGVDNRIVAVAPCIATADWMRPGSFEPPGSPDTYARRLYELLNPLTNTQNYAHAPAINFQSGADDRQVPPDGGQRFVEALKILHPCHTDKFDVTLHPNTSHHFSDGMWRNCLAWFACWVNEN